MLENLKNSSPVGLFSFWGRLYLLRGCLVSFTLPGRLATISANLTRTDASPKSTVIMVGCIELP